MTKTRPPQKPFILVDGSSYLYRAFHALPSLANSRGQPTGAIYGVLNMIRKLLADYDPEHIVVVFDAKGKTFRNDMYPAYKAHRPPMPDELVCQIQPLHQAIQSMGLPLVAVEGVEADDVIGTLAVEVAKQGRSVLISTGDKDIAQLVSPEITLVNTMTETVMDREEAIRKFGVPPERITDYLALTGDSVDNVPGVPNVGPKTAVKWLNQYGSLEGIIAHAHEVTGKVGDNLRNSLADLPLSHALVKLKLDVAFDFTLEDLVRREPDNDALREFFKEMEFKNWLKALLDEGSHQASDVDYQAVLTKEAFASWLEKLAAADVFAFDTETTSLDVMKAKIVGVSFAVKAGEAAYVPLAHDYLGAPEQLPLAWVLEQLKPILQDVQKIMVGQNLKYDLSILANAGLEVRNRLCDTLLISYVLDSSANRRDMDTLALKHLGKRTISFEEVAGKGVKQLTFNQVLLEQAVPYAAEDADITLQLYQVLWPEIESNNILKEILETVEFPLVRVLSHIERNGVMIDTLKLAEQSHQLGERILALQEKAYQLADGMFNLSSPKQLQQILYEKLELPVLSKTPTGAPSTAEEVLQELAVDYPLPAVILEYRGLSKLKSTYTDALPQQICPRTGRIHTSYNQAVTSTGRLSSTHPNLQNIPIKTAEGRRVRKAFIAPLGYKIVSADYSQIELRIMAHLSHDPGLLKAFAEDRDVHAATAAEVFGTPLEDVTAEQRRHAKAINFGLIYGMSAFGLAKQLQVDRQVAQSYIDRYFKRYPGVHDYMERIREQAKAQGYVETLLGRRLNIPDINSPNGLRRKGAERAAINAPMQGTAADIIKIAMIELDRWLSSANINAKMIMQVHDELVFEVEEASVPVLVEQVERLMSDAMALDIPLKVQVGIGDNWDKSEDG
jgi:DNA polymerase-1